MLPVTIRVYQTPSVCSEILNTVEELERHAAAGYFPREEDKALAANFVPPQPPGPPLNAEGLRLDGPTLEQFVAGGHKAENYPPKGYAAKPYLGILQPSSETVTGGGAPAEPTGPAPEATGAPVDPSASQGDQVSLQADAPAPVADVAPQAPKTAEKPAKPKPSQG